MSLSDLSFRPATYFRPQALEQRLIAKLKGTVLKQRLQKLIRQGRHSEVGELLAASGISVADHQAIAAVHPMFLGRNFLPETTENEVEIARITIRSTTWDVTSAYAKFEQGEIRYSIVDEYEGQSLTGSADKIADRPLTLGELIDFFVGAWDLAGVLQANYGDDLVHGLSFFSASSEFYPQLEQALREKTVRQLALPNIADDSIGDYEQIISYLADPHSSRHVARLAKVMCGFGVTFEQVSIEHGCGFVSGFSMWAATKRLCLAAKSVEERRCQAEKERKRTELGAFAEWIDDFMMNWTPSHFIPSGPWVAKQMATGFSRSKLRQYLEDWVLRTGELPSGRHTIVEAGGKFAGFDVDFDKQFAKE